MCIVDQNGDDISPFPSYKDVSFNPKSKKINKSEESNAIYDLSLEVSSTTSGNRMKNMLQSPSVRLRRSLSKIMKTSQTSAVATTTKTSNDEDSSGKVPKNNRNTFSWSNLISFLMCEGSISQIFDDSSITKQASVAPHQNEAVFMADSPLLQEYRKRNEHAARAGLIGEEKGRRSLEKAKPDQKKCCGPTLGSFLNISNNGDNIHEEVIGTYMNFRADEFTTTIFRQIQCSIPLYHHSIESSFDNEVRKNIDEIKHACSEPSSRSFEVRGGTYLLDSKKVLSDETLFALLGVDNIIKKKGDETYIENDVCKCSDSYFRRLKFISEQKGIIMPFLLVMNFVVPWGNVLAYFYRPDTGDGSPVNEFRRSTPSEKLWNEFLEGDENFRNNTLKFIPKVTVGPWAIKKLVGTQPAMIGQKIPTTYFGSKRDGYLEITMNVTKGGKLADAICSRVASTASLVSIDLAFLLQGTNKENLPEQLLSVMRLHHVRLKL